MTDITPNPAGKERAIRRAGMPKTLLIPIAAESYDAIKAHVGNNIEDIGHIRNRNAILVQARCGPVKSDLQVWSHPKSNVLNAKRQLWVRPKYSGYRAAFQRVFPNEGLGKQVVHHVMNRRYAALHGFEYVRVVAVSRSGNSSSGHSKNWGVELTKDGTLRNRAGDAVISYADLVSMMSMLDMPIGGGFMETVRDAARLLESTRSS